MVRAGNAPHDRARDAAGGEPQAGIWDRYGQWQTSALWHELEAVLAERLVMIEDVVD